MIRNYRASDFDDLLKLHREAEISDLTGACPSPSQLQQRLQHPRFNPEEDMLVVENKGKIVALLEMAPEKDIKRLILFCLVHPLHRGKKLASMLLDAVIFRAANIEAQVAHVNVARHNLVAQEVLRRLGFSHVRTFLEFRAKAGWIHRRLHSSSTRNDLSLRHLQPGEEALLARLQNRCFAGSWGFNPNTPQDICYTNSLGDGSLTDVIAAFQGSEPVAYCWNKPGPAAGKKGRIHMLGVVPEHRGTGIAALILQAGASFLCRRGKEVIELTTDGSNIPACRLYFSSGFRVWSETLWYEKYLSPEKK